ncbi:MAG TPA: asparagine synthase C-terminal domain-containing protein, partial [Candidatus Rifleibacterium sp.]|nr:asparagine synthase C-terminal domain-containing protein [Candidatus Rifleibacterium sp.]
RTAGKKVRTFTLGFNETEIDESPWAARIASHLGTSHKEFRLSSSEAENLIKELPDVYDEPFGDNSAVSTLMLSRLVSKEVKVVLSADGGDELFGGYDYYRKLPSDFNFFVRFPEAAKKLLAGAEKIIARPGLQNNINSFACSRLKKFLRNAAQIVQSCRAPSSGNFYRFMRANWQPYEISNLLGDYHEKRFSLDDLPDNLSLVEKMMAWDLFYYIPDDILTKVDRATMSTGLEGRDPFLDHRVIEMALQLPESMKIRNKESKSVLRCLLSRHIPSELFERPKRGFPIPLIQWRTNETGHAIAAEIDAFIAEGAFGLNIKTVRSELEFYRRSSGNEFQIWLLYVFASWARRWL